MKIALYLRVSTDKQTTENQRLELEQFAKAQGWDIVKEYSDDGFSGDCENRPEFNRMIEESKAGHFQCVLIYQLSRFGRSLSQIIKNIDLLTSNEVKFFSKSERISTLEDNPYAVVILALFGALAQIELQLMRERSEAGRVRAKAEGVKFGRKRDKSVNNEDIEALRNQKLSMQQIADKLGITKAMVNRRLAYIEKLNKVNPQIAKKMMLYENKTLAEVSKHFKVSPDIVREILDVA